MTVLEDDPDSLLLADTLLVPSELSLQSLNEPWDALSSAAVEAQPLPLALRLAAVTVPAGVSVVATEGAAVVAAGAAVVTTGAAVVTTGAVVAGADVAGAVVAGAVVAGAPTGTEPDPEPQTVAEQLCPSTHQTNCTAAPLLLVALSICLQLHAPQRWSNWPFETHGE